MQYIWQKFGMRVSLNQSFDLNALERTLHSCRMGKANEIPLGLCWTTAIKTHGNESQGQEVQSYIARKYKKCNHYCKSITQASVFIIWHHCYEWNLLPCCNFWIRVARIQSSLSISMPKSYKQMVSQTVLPNIANKREIGF